ncbi:4'-phosphopantetheinyl transferase superfamily protein [Lewinella sp. W8]|uniref:4'-phosphopantetheinyl transferase family protein n=1 Tax=Lewinella sp. W8 TaxID=2528208 RepID=UPI00106846BC|nr:4'-phosphopantetheinyl transferase superfamily protein [Lewinella sp. W8]MTB49705.1 4'-phosphopantetheinyl transferase superfamily protein [Lewinella sp. W8]
MPLLLHETLHPPGEWGLWHILESEALLRERTPLFEAELVALEQIKGEGRRREFLAARLLLHHMSGRPERGELIKDDSGKPHLVDSIFHVSISHTVDYAAAIAHPNPCGIDVQRIVPRIVKLADKFVNTAERSQLKDRHELVQLHLIWSAKEAMYKAFGRRKLDFKEHLTVNLEDFSPDNSRATAMLRKGNAEMVFDLTYQINPDFVMVACVEITL